MVEANGRTATRTIVETKNDQHVRVHYNTVKNSTRKHTKMMASRDFNNFIKWSQIFEFSKPYDSVLDMACGKGGDLEKWRRAGIDGWIGVDIADVSIENAQQRYRQLRAKTFWADFLVGNCFGSNSRETVLHPDTPLVDVISCQFASHYAFDTEERVRMTLENVRANSKPGGVFFGTTPNSDYLAKNLRRVMAEGKRDWGNDIYHITFDDDVELNDKDEFTKMWGNRYTFYSNEAVENVPEYALPIERFTESAKEYGSESIQKEPFSQYFERCVRESEGVLNEAIFKKLTDHRGIPTFDPEQLEVCSIYSCYAFRKV